MGTDEEKRVLEDAFVLGEVGRHISHCKMTD